jgi:glycogen debranching enzyme
VDLPDQDVLHPHYILMSAALSDPEETYALLHRLEHAGLFTPWGMVETISVRHPNYLPMNGSLNASFETLGAYHLLARYRGFPNAIYAASRQSRELRRAVQLFYPTPKASE